MANEVCVIGGYDVDIEDVLEEMSLVVLVELPVVSRFVILSEILKVRPGGEVGRFDDL